MRIDPNCADRLGLNVETLASIKMDRVRATPQDQAIYHTPQGLTLGNLSIAHAIHSASGAVFTAPFVSALGKWFEEGHLPEYIRAELPHERYAVFAGLKSKSSDDGSPYDADLIIEDKRRGKFLFVQAKYKFRSRMVGLTEELADLTSRNCAAIHGASQVAALRDRLRESTVIDQVRQRIGSRSITSDVLEQNAGFIVVHNVPAFDYCVSKEVALYEWNSFRNLLKDGQVNIDIGGETRSSTVSLGRPVAVESVDDALGGFAEHLLKHGKIDFYGSFDAMIKTEVGYSALASRSGLFGRFFRERAIEVMTSCR